MNYNKARWKNKRIKILKRDNYLCREYKRYGKHVEATTVHHIYPAEQFPELEWEDWNLISLSSEKHNAMHDRDTHEITELGRYWQDKVRDKYLNWYKKIVKPLQDEEQPEHPCSENKTNVYIVWGAPASGKTTYVKEHMQYGDLVVDLDLIKQSISMQTKEDVPDSLLGIAISIRNYLYDIIEYRDEIKCRNVWVVACCPTKTEREFLANKLQGKLVFIDATINQCIKNMEQDGERKNKHKQLEIINKWFENFNPPCQ